MADENKGHATNDKYQTTSARVSDRELVVTRIIKGPVHLVFEAWTKPDLMKQWWVPKSFGITLLSCAMDARTGGTYRFEFAHPQASEPMAFFGRYLDVQPNKRIVWTNEESEDGSVSTLTLEDLGGETKVIVHDLYPSKEALDAAIESGSTGAFPEQFEALDSLLMHQPKG